MREAAALLWMSCRGIIATVAAIGICHADEVTEGPPPLFGAHDPVTVTIVSPLKRVIAGREEEKPEEHEGRLIVADDAGTERSLDIKLRTRGKSRRSREVCRFPPLRLNFRKKQTEGTVFAGQDKLKLVTRCRDSTRFEQYLVKEYLAYRLLNHLTDASFRVRWLAISYVDEERDGRAEQHHGFLIEDDAALAERVGARVAEVVQASYESMDRDHVSLMFVFQYLLGNTDWSFRKGPPGEGCCHNAVLLEHPERGLLPVPYDFDYSGFVNPPYAEPPEQFNLRNVRQRLYRGPCPSRDEMAATLARFLKAEDTLLAVIRDEALLDNRHQRDLEGYVGEFYEVLRDERASEKAFFSGCD